MSKEEEITFEMACELGLIKDNALERAYKAAERCSILSPATDRFIESSYRLISKEIREKNRYVYFNNKKLKVI